MARPKEGVRRALPTSKSVARLGLFLILSSSVGCRAGGAHQHEVTRCETIVDDFIRTRKHGVRFPPGHTTGRKFTFFLHFPRTAGRSFFTCFLFKSYPPTHRCAPSYNNLRLEMSPPHCQILASHDDYSITDFFPPGATVLSQFRDPVDRFLSAYEFSVEISSRGYRLNRSDKGESGGDGGKKPRKDEDPHSQIVNTRDVWPWAYLVPYFDEDIDYSVRAAHAAHARRKELSNDPLPNWLPAMSEDGKTYYWHRETKESKWNLTEAERSDALPFLDPFDNPLYIPIKEFVEEPIADEVLNNGMTFQVLGITNYSYWPEAQAVRNCMLISSSAERKLMDFAKRRVDQMVHVSLTHKLPESAQSLAATLGLPLDGVTYSNTKTVLQRLGAEKLGVFEERYELIARNFSAYSNMDVLDLGVQAYHWYMTDKFKIRKPLLLDGEEYWRLHGLVEQKRRVFRHIQREILRRRKASDNDSVIPHPEMKPAHATEVKNETLWSSFDKCNSGTRRRQGTKRYKALGNVAHPDARRSYFTKKARKSIPKEVLDRIRQKNWLDEELFQYAVKVYDKQIQNQIKLGVFAKKLPEILIPSHVTPKRTPAFLKSLPKPDSACAART
ncbi:hypothetical protein BSKO_05069 [Bryopsis sp. KO-2023]|nr:hypothetical protein BSKO_05069 [Bryopsis sp. KO-2023]